MPPQKEHTRIFKINCIFDTIKALHNNSPSLAVGCFASQSHRKTLANQVSLVSLAHTYGISLRFYGQVDPSWPSNFHYGSRIQKKATLSSGCFLHPNGFCVYYLGVYMCTKVICYLMFRACKTVSSSVLFNSFSVKITLSKYHFIIMTHQNYLSIGLQKKI